MFFPVVYFYFFQYGNSSVCLFRGGLAWTGRYLRSQQTSEFLSLWVIHHLHMHTKQKSQKGIFFSPCSCRVKDYLVVFLALRKIFGGLSCRTCSCLKTLKLLFLKQWSPKFGALWMLHSTFNLIRAVQVALWCSLWWPKKQSHCFCKPFPVGAPGGVSGGEPVGGQQLARCGAGDGWALEWELLLQWPCALPGSTCPWGRSAKFTAGVWRSWAAQAGSVGESGNGGVLWNS